MNADGSEETRIRYDDSWDFFLIGNIHLLDGMDEEYQTVPFSSDGIQP